MTDQVMGSKLQHLSRAHVIALSGYINGTRPASLNISLSSSSLDRCYGPASCGFFKRGGPRGAIFEAQSASFCHHANPIPRHLAHVQES